LNIEYQRRSDNQRQYKKDWKRFQRKWELPAIIKRRMKDETNKTRLDERKIAR
jgi:hypothetical protein